MSKSPKDRIVYFIPHVFKASGGVYVLIKQAKILQENGYEVCIYYQPRKDSTSEIYHKINLDWVDFDLTNLSIIPFYPQNIIMSDNTIHRANGMTLGDRDILVIPEGFPNVMRAVKNSSCRKVICAQNSAYIFRVLNEGETWSDWGITDAITISQAIEKALNLTMPKIKTYNYYYSINRKLFYKPDLKEKTIVYLANRGGTQEIAANCIIKIFRQAYPKFTSYCFLKLTDLTREAFAHALRQASFALHLDDYVGLPTYALEAMACNTHVVGWPGVGGSEHVKINSGHWTPQQSLYETAEALAMAIEDYEEGRLEDRSKVYEGILEMFTESKERASVLRIFENLTQ